MLSDVGHPNQDRFLFLPHRTALVLSLFLVSGRVIREREMQNAGSLPIRGWASQPPVE